MKTNEIKSMSIAQLNAKAKELSAELFNLRFSHATRNLANPLAIRNVRRDIARVKTVMKEKQTEGGNNGK